MLLVPRAPQRTPFKDVTRSVQSFLLQPSTFSGQKLSGLTLRIQPNEGAYSFDIFHSNLATHLIKPILERSEEGKRIRYHGVKEVRIEILVEIGNVPKGPDGVHYIYPQFGPKKTLAIEGTTTQDQWGVTEEINRYGHNHSIWAIVTTNSP